MVAGKDTADVLGLGVALYMVGGKVYGPGGAGMGIGTPLARTEVEGVAQPARSMGTEYRLGLGKRGGHSRSSNWEAGRSPNTLALAFFMALTCRS
jgi:hypothetical protein